MQKHDPERPGGPFERVQHRGQFRRKLYIVLQNRHDLRSVQDHIGQQRPVTEPAPQRPGPYGPAVAAEGAVVDQRLLFRREMPAVHRTEQVERKAELVQSGGHPPSGVLQRVRD